jgi:hypothetical protein
MTSNSINSTPPPPQAESVKPTVTNNKPDPPPKQSSGAAATDSVHLSSAAQAQLSAFQAAVQEATETSSQTAKEAMKGDLQAQHLLAREAQAAQSSEYSPQTVRNG